MVIVDAAVEHGNDTQARASGDVPGLGGIHVGIDQSATLAAVVQAPLGDE